MTIPSTKVPTAREVARRYLTDRGLPDWDHDEGLIELTRIFEARDATLRSTVVEDCAREAEARACKDECGQLFDHPWCNAEKAAAKRVRALATRTGGNENE